MKCSISAAPMSRRRAMALFAALGTAALHGPGAWAEGPAAALHQAASACGLLLGSDSDGDISHAPPDYGLLLSGVCDLYAPNLAWPGMYPAAEATTPAWQDPNVPFALSHGMRLTGGHFLWHESLPAWVASIGSRDALGQAFTRHIDLLGRLYAGHVYAWNVVNEEIDPREGRPDGLRNSKLTLGYGPDVFDLAFHTARAADPHALLVYNDYDMEMDTPRHGARRAALLALVDRLIARKAPIDGVGLQSHIRLDGSRFNPAVYRAFLREIAAQNLKILITELDVLDLQGPSGDAARDTLIASVYGDFLRTALDEQAVRALTFWGLSDRYTWLAPSTGSYAVRSDGLPSRPCLFDGAFQPKPAYAAALSALQHAPKRQAG